LQAVWARYICPGFKTINTFMTFQVRLLTFVLLSSFIASCGSKDSNTKDSKNDQSVADLTGQITIDGSSTVYPITEAVAEEFRAEQGGVKVTVGMSGTGGGFKKFAKGETDINNASRLIKDQEKATCVENNIKYIDLKIAFDGLAVLVNKENTWVKDITVAELKKIWEPDAQGKITKWNQIRPDWPNQEFHLYGPGVASGTYDYFTEVIVGKSGASRGDFTASEDDNVLVQGIAGDKNALGFFGLAYYEENKEQLKLVGVNNGSGVVSPTTETVKNGTYAPLSRPIYIYVSDRAAKRPEIAAFVDFYLKNAASLVPDVGYISLPDEEYAKESEKFSTLVAGK
jgi:phosphate transport system substrate-binding protein